MPIKEAITFAAKELAPKGAELLAASMPKLAGTVIAAEARTAVTAAEGLLPKIELRAFSEYPPYASTAKGLKSMEHLWNDPSRHEFLSAQWSAGPTKFVDQWRYAVAPLSAPLETNNIYTCTALSVTDRRAGLHYLAHIDNDTSVADIIGSVSRLNLGQSSIRVLPGPQFFRLPSYGIDVVSRTNVEKTVHALNQIPNATKDFKFLHSNESNYYSIVSHEGRLYRGSPSRF